jgi:hypothetical protein
LGRLRTKLAQQQLKNKTNFSIIFYDREKKKNHFPIQTTPTNSKIQIHFHSLNPIFPSPLIVLFTPKKKNKILKHKFSFPCAFFLKTSVKFCFCLT